VKPVQLPHIVNMDDDLQKVKQLKRQLRERMWQLMEKEGVTLFPGAYGRIPNFVGRDAAAKRLAQLPIWRNARVIKCNPDAPQQPVRELALREGKIVYMAVPRLRELKCFVELLPDRMTEPHRAATIKGAFIYGRKVHPKDMRAIDLMVAGSVVVNPRGERLGKGGGFSDLEYAILRTFNLIDEMTPIVTTVHELQVVDFDIPVTPHDIPVDYIVTPKRVIKTDTKHKKPTGILWSYLTQDKIATVPIIQTLSVG